MSSCILSILGLVQPSPVNRLKSQLPGFPSLEDSFLIKLIMLRFQTSVLSRTVRITFAFGEAWKSSSQYMFPGMSWFAINSKLALVDSRFQTVEAVLVVFSDNFSNWASSIYILDPDVGEELNCFDIVRNFESQSPKISSVRVPACRISATVYNLSSFWKRFSGSQHKWFPFLLFFDFWVTRKDFRIYEMYIFALGKVFSFFF